MRIGILTFQRAYNCGALLQAWALKTVLEQMGHSVEFPVCNHVGESARWVPWSNNSVRGLSWCRSVVGRALLNVLSVPARGKTISRCKSFIGDFLLERVCEPNELGKCYDLLVVGSDQVWSKKQTVQWAPLFFGKTLPEDVRKIVYAASYGDVKLDADELVDVIDALPRFNAISVREPLMKDQLQKYSGKEIAVTLDPTLLLEGKEYLPLIEKINVPREPYLFCYTITDSKFVVNTVVSVAKGLGVRPIIAPMYAYSLYNRLPHHIYGIGPREMVAYTAGAKYVIADSFHGTVFGVHFNKPLLNVRNQVDEFQSRPAVLLDGIGSPERVVNPETSVDFMVRILRERSARIKDDSTSEWLVRRRSDSLSWLRENVEG